MELVVRLVVMCVFGAITAVLARQRGRSAVGWFFVGCFTGCIGIILVLVLPDQRAQEERERRLAAENRRLKEQLRKDRMVADQRHAEVQARLSVHDTALGVDTAPAARTLPSAAAAGAGPETAQWWYVHGGARNGPVAFAELRELWEAGTVDGATRVWTSGMSQWTPIEEHARLREALGG